MLAKTDPPLLSIPAALAARLKGARLVNWCQDLFPETAAALGLRWAAGPVGRLLRRLRNWSLRQADCNVVLCDEMLSYLEAAGIAPRAQTGQGLRIVHNWPDPAIRPLPRERRPGEPFTICYSGNLGRAHAVGTVIELVERTRDLPGLRWRFVGGGAGFFRLRDHVDRQGIANVSFEGYAPRSELPGSLACADAHLVSLDPACEGLIQPSKIYGILASGRPALFLGSPRGSVVGLLRQHAAGIALDMGDPATWRPAIEALIGDTARLAAMGANARRAHERHYAQAQALAAWRDVLLPVEVTAPDGAEPSLTAENKAKVAA